MKFNLNRRNFLLGTAATAALAGCATTPARARGTGKKLKVAVIGYGIQARTALIPQFIRNENVVIIAVADCDKVRREAGAKHVNDWYAGKKMPANCKAVADFRDVLKDPAVDAVCIATPDHWHAYMSVEAMKAGKDVYCEKPLTFSVEEAIKVYKAQEKYGAVFQTGAMQRSWNEFRTAVKIVRNGFIGDVKYVDCNYGASDPNSRLGGPSQPHRFFSDIKNAAKEGAPNPDCDWDMWLGPAPWSPYSDQCAPRGVNHFYPMFWRFDDNFGSGYNGDWGAHHLDIAQWGLNLDKSGPVKVVRSDAPYSQNPIHGCRRQFGMKFILENGCEIYHNPFSVWGTVFYGTKGIVAVNRGKIAVWLGNGVKPTDEIRAQLAKAEFGGMTLIAASVGKDYGTDATVKKDNRLDSAIKVLEKHFDLANAKEQLYYSKNQVDNFVECCETGKMTISPAEVGARAAILCLLCNLSYIYDVSFDWDPVKNTFANGTGDPNWLKRPYNRNGWDVVV